MARANALCVFFALVFVAVCSGTESKRGVCLTVCDRNTSYPCQVGYKCGTNGCGHQCYKQESFTQPEGCAPIDDDCAAPCLQGLKRDNNGCEICECYYHPYTPK